MALKLDLSAATLSPYVSRILSVFYAASTDEHVQGLIWYDVAREIAQSLAVLHDLDVTVTVGLLALLSPQKAWAENITEVEKVLALFSACGRTVNFDDLKALRLFASDYQLNAVIDLLSGVSPAVVNSAQKVSSFTASILGSESDVCIDGHAYNIAFHGLTRVGIGEAKSMGAGLYQTLQHAYRIAAVTAGVTPVQVQAITWVVYRNLDTAAKAKAKAKKMEAAAVARAAAKAAKAKK